MSLIDCFFYVKPNTISDLTIWKDGVQIYPTITISGEYFLIEYEGSSGTATLKATGYEDLEIPLLEGPPEYYTMVSLSQPISNISDGTNTYVIKDAEARVMLSNKQDTLVSGINIKTINNTSLLGSGDITTPFRNIGEIVASTIPLTDAGLHLLDGALIDGNGIYSDFVDYIASIYDASANYFCTEAEWQQSVTDYGACGKFVYDDANNTVRLPKITGFVEGTINPTTLGDLTQAGLPNITASWNSAQYDGGWGTPEGAVYGVKNNSPEYNSGSAGMRAYFNASRSSSIYGNSSTVQPQSIKVLYYIVIANTTKTQVQVDLDQVATDLNGKADVDLTNVNDSGMVRSAHWAMPSTTYNDLTVGSSGTTYTAPADGWVKFSATTNNNNQYVQLYATMTSLTVASGTTNVDAFIPVRKGEIFQIWYTAPNNKALRFYYAIGSESEAN